MTGLSAEAADGAKALNVDGDLLSGETPSWTVVDADGDARLYVEDGEGIVEGGAYVEHGRVVEVGMVEEREFGEGVPLTDVASGEELEFVYTDEFGRFDDVVAVSLVS